MIPHYFKKEPIPEITHPDLKKAIQQVQACPTVNLAMHTALEILTQKFQSKHFETYLLFFKAFETDPNKLWERSGFLHCTHQNCLFRTLMVGSGHLRDEQIELGYSLVWYVSPHQFLKVKLPTGTIAVDPWNYEFGARIGTYASGFGWKKLS